VLVFVSRVGFSLDGVCVCVRVRRVAAKHTAAGLS